MKELSKRYKFSLGVLSCLERVYRYELEQVLKALKKPGQRHYFRINTLKTKKVEILKRFKDMDLIAGEDEVIDEALYLPVEGPFEISFPNKKIMVDKFTAESAMMGINVYAPGIRKCTGIRLNDELAIINPFMQSVASGIARMSEREILGPRKGLAVEVNSSIYRVPNLRETLEYEEGLIYLQSKPSILTSKILDPNPNELIVDLTCSPGGKLSHISQLMGNEGRIIAVDRNSKKISATRETLQRLGCKNVELLVQDGRYFHIDLPNIKADKCIVDPPCSALGITPKLYDFTSEKEINSLADYQKQFLKAATKIVKKGGKIIYSVCTITIEECERVAEFAIKECGLEIDKQISYLGSRGLASEDFQEANLLQRFHPHKDGMGYFIAKFNRK